MRRSGRSAGAISSSTKATLYTRRSVGRRGYLTSPPPHPPLSLSSVKYAEEINTCDISRIPYIFVCVAFIFYWDLPFSFCAAHVSHLTTDGDWLKKPHITNRKSRSIAPSTRSPCGIQIFGRTTITRDFCATASNVDASYFHALSRTLPHSPFVRRLTVARCASHTACVVHEYEFSHCSTARILV